MEQRFDATIENVDGETIPDTGIKSKKNDGGVQRIKSRAIVNGLE